MAFFGKKKKQKSTMVPFSEFSVSREKRAKPDRRSESPRILWYGVLWCFFLGCLLYVLFFSDETTVRDISYRGNHEISSDTLDSIVSAEMGGRYFHIFPRNNFFFFPRAAVIRDMRESTPVLRSVSIRNVFPASLIFEIEERPEVIVWRSANGDFILDEEGHAQSHPNIESILSLASTLIVLDEDGKETQSGDAVIDASLAASLPEYRRKFESRFGKRLSPEVQVLSRFSGELVFHSEDGFDMIVDGHRSVDDTLSTFQAALDKGIPEADRGRLSRVDLRTENKVYYTIKEQ